MATKTPSSPPRGGDPDLAPKPVSASQVTISLLATPETRNIFGSVHGGWIMRQVDETVPALAELVGHPVERLHRAADLVPGDHGVRLPGFHAPRPVAGGEIGEAFGELTDRPADAMGNVDERRQRNQPGGAE